VKHHRVARWSRQGSDYVVAFAPSRFPLLNDIGRKLLLANVIIQAPPILSAVPERDEKSCFAATATMS
jgi:hypothetical protein